MAQKSAGADDNGKAQIKISRALKARLHHAGVETDRTKWEDLLSGMCGLYEVEHNVPFKSGKPGKAVSCPP